MTRTLASAPAHALGRLLTFALGVVCLVGPVAAAAANDAVASSPEEVRPLLVGSSCPAVTVTSIDGEPFDLAAAVTSKPTVLIFYRGGW